MHTHGEFPMPKQELKTTLTMRNVYAALINPENLGFCRTQTQVSKMLDLPKSTVSDHVRHLVEMEFIRPMKGHATTDKTYVPGKYHRIIEEYIRLDRVTYGIQFDTNGLAVTNPASPEPYVPLSRTHLNGGWIWFNVEQEGSISYIPALHDHSVDLSISGREEGKKPIMQSLFGNVKPNTKMRGQTNWQSSFLFNNDWLTIRYLKTKTKMMFGVVPGDIKQHPLDVTDEGDAAKPFMPIVRPFLQYLEKYAGWKFEHTETGDYQHKANVKQEYAMDENITAILTETMGDDHGIPGVTPMWKDHSPGAMGSNGEYEFGSADFVHAIYDLPKIDREFPLLVNKVADLTEQIAKDKLQITEMIASVSSMVKTVAKNQMELATTIRNQSEIELTREILHSHQSVEVSTTGGL